MSKILTRSGESLADLYEVEGSIAGIEQLETRELPIVHEMGSTVFSERIGGIIRRADPGALTQNNAFDTTLATNFPGVWRVINVTLLATVAARVSHVQVSLRDADSGREVPLVAWDSGSDIEILVRIVENGGAAANQLFLRVLGTPPYLPVLAFGAGQRDQVQEIVFRGATLGFGAGTVDVTALIYVAFTHAGGLSSRGLPIPSW